MAEKMNQPQQPLEPGIPAPDFTLETEPHKTVSLHDFRGQPVILAFYPADWSGVCSSQMSLYNQVLPEFEKYNAELLGISVDSAYSHQAFRKDRNLHFLLLADYEPKGEIARKYGAYDYQKGRCERALFVLDSDGIIRWSYLSPSNVNPGADGILDALEGLKQKEH
jgi:peroxiredoxin